MHTRIIKLISVNNDNNEELNSLLNKILIQTAETVKT